MNKSGQMLGIITSIALGVMIVFGSFGYAIYKSDNPTESDAKTEKQLRFYMSQIIKDLRDVDYERLDFVVPQGRRLTKDGVAYYKITLGKESKHKNEKYTRQAIIKVGMNNSKESIKETIILSSDKNDYKGVEMFENTTDIKNNEKSAEKNLLKE